MMKSLFVARSVLLGMAAVNLIGLLYYTPLLRLYEPLFVLLCVNCALIIFVRRKFLTPPHS
jgi:hypothetical protein